MFFASPTAGPARQPLLLLCALLLIPLALPGLVACGGEDSAESEECRRDLDCVRGRSCVEGACILVECREDHECEGDQVCTGRRCVGPGESDGSDVSAGDTSEDVTDTGSGDTSDVNTDVGDTDEGPGDSDVDTAIEQIPLVLVEATPVAESAMAARDFVVELRFNQALDPSSFPNGANLALRDGVGTQVAFTVEVDEDDETLMRIQPDATARTWANTWYEVEVNRNVRGVTGGRLAETLRHGFTTAPLEGLDAREAWARHYAPVLQLEVDNLRHDTFTRIDFDGDLDTSNNRANAGGPQAPWVYWSVTATATHAYLHYVLYFPGGVPVQVLPDTEPFEHHLVGILVLARLNGEPFGQFEAAATFAGNTLERFWGPPSGQDPAAAPGGLDGRFTASEFTGDRGTLLIRAGNHALCPSSTRTMVGTERCRGEDGAHAPFGDGLGRTFQVASPEDEIAAPAVGDRGPLPYGLIPIETSLWGRRHLSGGQGDLFTELTTYTAPEERPPGEEDEEASLLFPTALKASNPINARGDLPFSWGRGADRGTWLLDPYHYVSREITVAEPMDGDWCFHPYFEIVDRETCPESLFVADNNGNGADD